jgi:hypothetical protein
MNTNKKLQPPPGTATNRADGTTTNASTTGPRKENRNKGKLTEKNENNQPNERTLNDGKGEKAINTHQDKRNKAKAGLKDKDHCQPKIMFTSTKLTEKISRDDNDPEPLETGKANISKDRNGTNNQAQSATNLEYIDTETYTLDTDEDTEMEEALTPLEYIHQTHNEKGHHNNDSSQDTKTNTATTLVCKALSRLPC